MNLRRVRAVARKEFLHVFRDPRSLGMAIAIPMLMLILFGYALTLDVDRVPMVVWDQSGTHTSHEFVSRFGGSRYFTIVGSVGDYRALGRAIDTREAMAALVIPVDFSDRVESGRRATVQWILDGSDSNRASIVLAYAESVTGAFSHEVALETLRRAGLPPIRQPLDFRPRVWFNSDMESKNYIVPGLIAVIMMVIAALITSLTVAREWEQGTMEQLISTPVTGRELILGKLIPYFAIGMFDVLLAVLMGEFLFGVPLRGSVALLFAMAAIFLVGGLAMGMLVSIVTKSQLVASQIAMVTTFPPAFLLSGFMFSIANMPKVIQAITYIVPARYFVSLLKGIYLKGVGLEVLALEAGLLTAYAVIMVLLANAAFQEETLVAMFERIRHMLVKEFLQVFRDPRMRMVIFVIPCVQTLVIGYAVSTDVQHVATAVYDLDNTEDSRAVVDRFTQSGYFDAVEYVENDAQAREAIDRGRAGVVLRMDRGFSEDLRGGRTAKLQMIVDGSDSNTAWIVLGYAARIAGGMSEQLLVERFTRRFGVRRDPGLVELKSRSWFNENLESRNFFVPGVIVVVVTLVTLLLTSMAVVREKEVGTMEQIIVTPITPAEFILGKTVPFALIAFVDVALVSVVGVYVFGVPVRGSLGLLFFATALYLMTTLGAGLLISTISRTQQQAMMSTFFFFFPAMLLSGFVFPVANMPRVVQWLDMLNPLVYFLVIVRGIFLKGVGMDVLWPEISALAVMGALTLWLASRRFHKTLA